MGSAFIPLDPLMALLTGAEKGTGSLTIDHFYVDADGNERYHYAISPGGCLYDPSHREYEECHKAAIGDSYRVGQLFDWTKFNLDEANKRLQDALNSRSSAGGGGIGCECCQAEFCRPVKDKKRISVCAQCGDANNLKVCGACEVVFYCSSTCQKANWKGHKSDCKRMKEEKANYY